MGDDDEIPVDLMLDLSLKKKKKKKKEGDESAEAALSVAPAGTADDGDDDVAAMLDLSDKKKKKKKKDVVEDDDAGELYSEAIVDAGADDEIAVMLDLSSKKKKSKKKSEIADVDGEHDDGIDVADDEMPWLRDPSERDYTYSELLGRIYGFLRKSNPELGERKRFLMKPPQVFREGTKRTVLANFQELADAMHRSPDHLLNYMLAEMGTSGSVDGSKRIVFKGRFQPKHIESLLRRYVGEYVLCALCRSPDTELKKDNATRLYFVNCASCGASRSVQLIKTGYKAQIGKRKKL